MATTRHTHTHTRAYTDSRYHKKLYTHFINNKRLCLHLTRSHAHNENGAEIFHVGVVRFTLNEIYNKVFRFFWLSFRTSSKFRWLYQKENIGKQCLVSIVSMVRLQWFRLILCFFYVCECLR